MGKCLLVSGSLEVCNNNFLHFCVYSCYRNCYAKVSCGEGQVKKNCIVLFSLRTRGISYALVIACHIFISFFLFKRNFAKKRWLWFLQGFWYFAEKKAKFSGIFRGKFAEKSADFAGKKSKFAEQSADFGRFSREKSQNSQKNRPISRDFSGKKSNFEGFSGANS